MTKDQANQLAKQYGWTGADAERAYAALDLKNVSEQDLLLALVQFAGPELSQRQRLQAAQKGLVTKKKKELEATEKEFEQHLQESQKKINEMRSLFIPIIKRFYEFGKPFGLYDAWIEAMLETYDKYHEIKEDSQDNQVA
ncbi:hypothetical protein B1L04_26570 [Microcystis aeruginosa KW]|uniref:Uncharacterized protein n=1 Tax=Microcystis aeruginosa KW TaxID=1960155 RepID=A0A1V4BPJ2_MICAE|nr:hypothetical protein [Microcystis aeruginosa]OPF15954.1 hypothetical protein B1L04_26570 [Microcystis aeruginosa KW]